MSVMQPVPGASSSSPETPWQASGPLRAVLDAVQDGAPTPAAVARITGLPLGLVRLTVDRLVATGALAPAVPAPTAMAEECGGGCGGCPLASAASGCLARARLLTPSRQPDD